jgi:hypothetical protein
MISRAIVALVVVLPFSLSTADAAGAAAIPAAEYSQHFDALGKLSLAVAGTMPTEQYAFRPHPESMSFGALMSHIANPNYAFCAGLKDTPCHAFTRRHQQGCRAQVLEQFLRLLLHRDPHRRSNSTSITTLLMAGFWGGKFCSPCT